MDELEVKEKGSEVHREVFTVRPATTTRPAIRITVRQMISDSGELALCSISLSGELPFYLEKPDLLEDLGMAMIRAAGAARKWNRHVKNGQP